MTCCREYKGSATVVKTAEVSKVPLWAQTGAFSLITHSAINILLLWAAVVLAHYSEDGLLIKLFTDEWFAGLSTRCLNETGFPEGIGCYSERVVQLRWSGVPSASRGFLVLCRNVCPVSARGKCSSSAHPRSFWVTDRRNTSSSNVGPCNLHWCSWGQRCFLLLDIWKPIMWLSHVLWWCLLKAYHGYGISVVVADQYFMGECSWIKYIYLVISWQL